MAELVFGEEPPVGFKLVPWFSWDEWEFVRKSIFSPSADSVSNALIRISTWRSRGCLPSAIEVTAAVVEVQQKDPFFRECLSGDALYSDELLIMAYCMAIIRLVNSFAEKSRKRTGLSISESADAIGIPRMLIDIRHECSHSELPSLALVRLASAKALDWLKSYYWKPQRKLIPNVNKEVKSRLREMLFYINAKPDRQGKPLHVKRRRHKRINKTVKSLIRLYSSFPSKVLAILLEEFLRSTTVLMDDVEVIAGSNNSRVDMSPSDPRIVYGTTEGWKAVILKLSIKEPALLLAMVEAVLKMIEVRKAMTSETGECIRQIHNLSCLVPWLIQNFEKTKDPNSMGSREEIRADSHIKGNLPQLLRKCLLLLVPTDIPLLDSALILASMIGKDFLTEKLKKLPLLSLPDPDATLELSISNDLQYILLGHENSLSHAAKELENLKLRRRRDDPVSTRSDTDTEGKVWTVADSWRSCPIGNLPYSFGPSTVLPIHGKQAETKKSEESTNAEERMVRTMLLGKRDASYDVELLMNAGPTKKTKGTESNGGLGQGQRESSPPPVEGRLLIGGIWKKVGEEELHSIESAIRVLL